MWRPIYEEIHPRFRWMRDYLLQVAPPGKLPGRQHLEPVIFKRLLPFINLVDVDAVDGGLRFRYRLVGTLQTKIAGREITGLYLEDAVLPLFVERIRNNMTACAEQREAIYDAFAMPHPDRDFIRTERVYYPLARDGEAVDMLLILNGYPDDEAQTGPLPPDLPDVSSVSQPPETETPAR
ncbi:MAG: hypothetical protein ACK4GK_17405 [Ferrovibrio sp.]|jgi:hypothetical protein